MGEITKRYKTFKATANKHSKATKELAVIAEKMADLRQELRNVGQKMATGLASSSEPPETSEKRIAVLEKSFNKKLKKCQAAHKSKSEEVGKYATSVDADAIWIGLSIADKVDDSHWKAATRKKYQKIVDAITAFRTRDA